MRLPDDDGFAPMVWTPLPPALLRRPYRSRWGVGVLALLRLRKGDAMKDETLKLRQQAGEKVERQMLEFLMQFSPAGELKLSDAKVIAFHARSLAFENFSELA